MWKQTQKWTMLPSRNLEISNVLISLNVKSATCTFFFFFSGPNAHICALNLKASLFGGPVLAVLLGSVISNNRWQCYSYSLHHHILLFIYSLIFLYSFFFLSVFLFSLYFFSHFSVPYSFLLIFFLSQNIHWVPSCLPIAGYTVLNKT